MMLAKLQQMLRKECAVDPRQTLVLGFSGGPDSLALLHALHSLGQPLLAAHLDHGLRPDSAVEARQAESIAKALAVPFVAETAKVGAYAEEQGKSIEEAARELRYRFLFRVAGKRGAQGVAVAHTADDQVETVLMHLLRGAGSAGLRGMAPRLLPNPWNRVLPLVRPLLGVWRREILEYCAANSLQPLQDPSNQDNSYFRNRLRHELVPKMESLAPGFKRRLAQSAQLLAADYELLSFLAEEAWRRCLRQAGSGFLQFDRTLMLAEPLAIQRALLRSALAELRPEHRNLDFAAVERALELARNAGQSGPVDWVAGLYLFVEEDWLWIAAWDRELPVDWPQAPEGAVPIGVPGDLALKPGWRLVAKQEVNAKPAAARNTSEYETRLDLDAVGEKLVLRRPRPGDRFQPLGLERGSLKLSDFFINVKLPRRARAAWPLVCCGEEIVWVAGLRLAHAYRLQPKSQRVLQLKLEKTGV